VLRTLDAYREEGVHGVRRPHFVAVLCVWLETKRKKPPKILNFVQALFSYVEKHYEVARRSGRDKKDDGSHDRT
jgi:hypothetical protein